jgi:hypothetical protein
MRHTGDISPSHRFHLPLGTGSRQHSMSASPDTIITSLRRSVNSICTVQGGTSEAGEKLLMLRCVGIERKPSLHDYVENSNTVQLNTQFLPGFVYV